jgi:hypothetical protein
VQLGLIKVEVGGYVLTEEGINKVVAGGFTWQYWQSFAKTGFQVIASVALLYVSVAGFYNDVKKNDKPSWQLQAELNKLRQAEKVVLYKDSTYTEYLLYHLPK